MELDKKEKDLINTAIDEWVNSGRLSADKADELKNSIIDKKPAGQLAQYFFVIAIACTLLAFGAIFIDDRLLEKIKTYFDIGNIIIAAGCTVISVLWFGYMYRKKSSFNTLNYEVYMVMGGLVVLSGLVYYCKDLGFGENYTGFLSAASVLLFILAILFRSKTLWLGGILALMGWYGSFSESASNLDNLFIGMNYPMRYTVFGALITGLGLLQLKIKALHFSQRLTYLFGLLIFFTGMWGVSIFGNYGHYDEWILVRQTQVLVYAAIFGILSIIALSLGIRYKDALTRDFAIIFIIINLYTRYFEFFWDTTNKGIFFLILAGSFWFIGRWLEKRRKKLSVANS